MAVATDYQFIAQNAAAVALGPNGGKKGDILRTLVFRNNTTSPGVLQITDGSLAPITLFTGGVSSIIRGKAVRIAFGRNGIKSKDGPWKVTTGLSLRVTATGKFT
jgi:hypothetical protein